MASGRLPSVADIPHITSAGLNVFNRASDSCVCTPRLLPNSSCHSSTTTACTLPSATAASARDSNTDRLSGVVTSTVGRRVFWTLRSALGVSLLLTPVVQCAKCACPCNMSSGCCRARRVSAASARIGVIHSTASGAPTGLLPAFFSVAPGVGFDWLTAIKRIKIPSQTA